MLNRVLFLLAIVAYTQTQGTTITYTLFATSMSGCDDATSCDLRVAIRCASASSDWSICGETSKRQDDDNPVWPEVFTLEHVKGTSQRWRFDLIDEDVAFDDVIATLEVNVDTYAEQSGNLYQIPIPGKTGILWIHRR